MRGDAFTNNATQGVALLWPLSTERMLFGFRPIEALPISVQRFLSERGLQVLRLELLWVWVPLLGIGLTALVLRRRMRAP
ncbi:MAG TPA: hypothetical protein VF178_07155 [Gemmatimonadaceae bacterium]